MKLTAFWRKEIRVYAACLKNAVYFSIA